MYLKMDIADDGNEIYVSCKDFFCRLNNTEVIIVIIYAPTFRRFRLKG